MTTDRQRQIIKSHYQKVYETDFCNIEETGLLTIGHQNPKHSNRPQDH